MEDNSNKQSLSVLDYTIAGATSGVITRGVCQPFDVLKIRFQIQDYRHGKLKYVGVLASCVKIMKEEGLSALWKGHISSQALSIVFGAVQFLTYEATKEKMLQNQYPINLPGLEFLSGGIAGIASTIACQPLDVLRTRLVAQTGQTIYKNTFHAIQMMMQENGIRTFYQGFVPALWVMFPYTGLNFLIYGSSKRIWNHLFQNKDSRENIKRLSCGAFSGLCSKLTLLPFDVVKKRLQVQGFGAFDKQYNGMYHCFQLVFKSNGVFGLYKGAVPSIWKATLTSGMMFFSYEYICDILKELNTR